LPPIAPLKFYQNASNDDVQAIAVVLIYAHSWAANE